jgi:flavodoxin
MKIEVRYVSRGGNTKKVAEAIAKAIDVEAKDCSIPLTAPVDLLFLGGSVYWGGADKNLKQFIEQLNPSLIKCIATFGTSALTKEPDRETAKLADKKGIPVSQFTFHCKGSFSAMHKGRPNAEDLKQAAIFARNVVNELK